MIAPGETRRRGEVLESIYHDTTKVGNPPAASVLVLGDRFLVVPVDPQRPILERDTQGDAVSLIERMIGSEQ